jgi:ParB family transcriptional regulator, chromosome partitioning protein
MAQKSVLGKGLASLLPGATGLPGSPPPSVLGVDPSKITNTPIQAPPVESGNRDRHLGISMAAVEDIHANQLQPRREFDEGAIRELAQSIKSSGIIQPLVVRKSQKEGFELIAGERRLRAAKLAGLKHVPIVIRRSTDREALELALIENIQRQNLNCIDEALAYTQLGKDFSLTQEDISERVGKDRATVANYMRLLRLPTIIIEDLKKQLLTFGHGKALVGVEDPEMRIRLRNQIIENHLSVRETEHLIESIKNQLNESTAAKAELQKGQNQKTPIKARLQNLSQDLARQWSTKIEIRGSERRGKIVIHYSNRQELDRIVEDLQTKKV